jgi:hypothetical protein
MNKINLECLGDYIKQPTSKITPKNPRYFGLGRTDRLELQGLDKPDWVAKSVRSDGDSLLLEIGE